MVDRQASDRGLELIPVEHRIQPVRCRRERPPTARAGWVSSARTATSLGKRRRDGRRQEQGGGAHRGARRRNTAASLLGRVLGEIDLAQDPTRDGEEPRRDLGGDQPEGFSVAMLGPGPRARYPHPSSVTMATVSSVVFIRYGSRRTTSLQTSLPPTAGRGAGPASLETDRAPRLPFVAARAMTGCDAAAPTSYAIAQAPRLPAARRMLQIARRAPDSSSRTAGSIPRCPTPYGVAWLATTRRQASIGTRRRPADHQRAGPSAGSPAVDPRRHHP